MAVDRFLFFSLMIFLVAAEPPSPYQYNKPQPVAPPSGPEAYNYNKPSPPFNPGPAPVKPQIPSTSYGTPIPGPPRAAPSAPSGSYGAPSLQLAPSIQPAPSFQSQPAFVPKPSASYGSPSSPPSFIAPPSKPSSSYGAPLNFNTQSSNLNSVVTNSAGGNSVQFDQLDSDLRSAIESILQKEESRLEAELDDSIKVFAISMDQPRESVGVADFVLRSSGSQAVNVPAPVYGPAR